MSIWMDSVLSQMRVWRKQGANVPPSSSSTSRKRQLRVHSRTLTRERRLGGLQADRRPGLQAELPAKPSLPGEVG